MTTQTTRIMSDLDNGKHDVLLVILAFITFAVFVKLTQWHDRYLNHKEEEGNWKTKDNY